MMTRKSYEVTLRICISVEELTDELARSNWQRLTNYEEMLHSPEAWWGVERQRRLLEALLEDEAALRQYVGSFIAGLLLEAPSSINQATEQIRAHVGARDAEEEAVKTVLDRLESEDASFFKRSIEAGLLAENMEEVDACIREKLVEAKLVEIAPERKQM